MKNLYKMGALALMTASLCACATVTRGTKQKMEFTSTPEGASVKTSEGYSCVTPCKTKLKRKTGFEAVFTKEGYEPATVKVRSKFSGGGAAAGAGNILLGGIIGGVVDGSNGSLNNLTPNPVKVVLVPTAVAPVAPAAEPMTAEAVPADAVAVDTVPAEAALAAETAPAVEAAPAAPTE